MSQAYTCITRSRSACLHRYLPICVGIALYGYEIYLLGVDAQSGSALRNFLSF